MQSPALFYLKPAANQSINKVIGHSLSKLEANIAYIQLLMCSFSEGWKTELPCSSGGLARKDYVVPVELRAKIAASSTLSRRGQFFCLILGDLRGEKYFSLLFTE